MTKQEAQRQKTLILVRHAHRDKALPDADNGLSDRGKKQASLLSKYFKRAFDDARPEIYSSPKKRCIETVEKIAKRAEREIQIVDCLNESETQADLIRRVTEFMRLLQQSRAPLIVASSHGDWIPVFLDKILGIPIDLEKGAWAQLELNSKTGENRLVELIQDFSFLSD
jgi:broad specificity phosphatase PhoE